DQPLERITYDDFIGVTKSKVYGTLALLETFSSPHLLFFLSLSSVANIVGARGLGSYNAGNAVQDALSQPFEKKNSQESEKGGPRMLTVNIGWIRDAVQTRDSETRQRNLRRAGFSLLDSEELKRFFDYMLEVALDAHSTVSQAVIGFDTASLAEATAVNGNVQSALFSLVHGDRSSKTDGQDGKSKDAQTKGPTFEEVVTMGNSEAVSEFIAGAMKSQIARLISAEAASIDARQGSILALGLDSLVAVELRNWLMRQFQAPLQSSEILADQTIYTLAGKVASRSRMISAAAA
ncbi:polyketide synthase, partial [Neopestalotiopsis sp. 37M]